jgi:hypothetical protein
MKRITLTVDCGLLGENDITFEVRCSPGTPDVLYLRNGDPGYPGDPEELEIVSAKRGDIDITQAFTFDHDRLHELLCEQARDDDDDCDPPDPDDA